MDAKKQKKAKNEFKLYFSFKIETLEAAQVCRAKKQKQNKEKNCRYQSSEKIKNCQLVKLDEELL